MPAPRALEIEVRPPWPYRLPARGGADGVMRARGGIVKRLLHVDGEPVVVAAWRRADGEFAFRAARSESADPDREPLERAIERMRFALGVDDDYSELYARFKLDPLLGPAIRRRPWHRPARRPLAWEALAWSVTKQLIESTRAAEIERRIVRRWGPRVEDPRIGLLRDVPSAELIAGRAPAELTGMDLSAGRSLALIRCAREVAAGRVDPGHSAGDRRLLRIPEIGPWTVQCLGLYGRGDPDSLPAGDLGFIKLVGRLAGLGRRATVEEVEEFYAPYAPYRGLAGSFTLMSYHGLVAKGPPLRVAA
jgi:3-methyladenine DNA glycosylase/8-oxoguanine DNA glycosylase